jgi:hypothetical protein
VEEKYFGDSNASRHSFYRNLSQDQMRKAFEARVTRYANQAAFGTASVSGTQDNSGQIIENFSFNGAFANASTGDSWFFQPLFLSGISVPEISPQPRVLPLEVGSPYHVKGEYRIILPAGMRVGSVPEETSLESDFGSLDVAYSTTGNVIVANYELSFTMSRVPPDKFEAFRAFINSVRRAGQVRLRAMKTP